MCMITLAMKVINEFKGEKGQDSRPGINPDPYFLGIFSQEWIGNCKLSTCEHSTNGRQFKYKNDAQLPLFIEPQCSTQEPYHMAKVRAAIGAITWTSLLSYFLSKRKKSSMRDTAGTACKARYTVRGR
jgi:hypothetical protein